MCSVLDTKLGFAQNLPDKVGLRLHFQLKFNIKYILQKKCTLQRKLFHQENLHCHQNEQE